MGTNKMVNILLIGPLPPPLSGTTVSFQTLVTELSDIPNTVSIDVFNTSANKDDGGFKKLIAATRLLRRVSQAAKHNDILMLNASNGRAVIMGWMLNWISKRTGKPLVIRIFGGAFREHYETLPSFHKRMAQHVLMNNVIMIQTRLALQRVQELVPEGRFHWFPNSRPIPNNFEKKSGPAMGHFYYAGEIRPEKGIDTLLQVAKIHQGTPLQVDLYGKLFPPYSKAMLESASTKHVQISVKGVVPSIDLARVVPHYDALLFPTRYVGEGYPGSVLEAMGHGVPVICSRWESIPELVNETCGILVSPEDLWAWESALTLFNEDEELRSRLSIGARKQAENFDSKIWHQENLVDLFQKLTAGELL